MKPIRGCQSLSLVCYLDKHKESGESKWFAEDEVHIGQEIPEFSTVLKKSGGACGAPPPFEKNTSKI